MKINNGSICSIGHFNYLLVEHYGWASSSTFLFPPTKLAMPAAEKQNK